MPTKVGRFVYATSAAARSPEARRRRLLRGWVALFFSMAVWMTPALFMYYLAGYFDVWSQNFFRYLSGALAITPLLLLSLRKRRERGGFELRALRDYAASSVPNAVHQITQTLAVIALLPGLYAIIGRMSVVFTGILAVVLFANERWIVRSPFFLLGIVLGLAGAIGIVWFRPGEGGGEFSIWGLLLAMVATLTWSIYSVMVKEPTVRYGAAPTFVGTAMCTSLLLLPGMLVWGNPMAIFSVPWEANFWLIASGVACIGIGHVLFYMAINELGATLSQALLLLCPLGTALLSWVIFGETMQWAQILSGAVLLLGSLCTVLARPPAIVAESD